MEVKLPREITLNHITAIIAVISFLFGACGAFFYMKYQGEQNTAEIQDISVTQKERGKETDQKFSNLQDSVGDLKISMAKVEAAQSIVSGQITQVQMDMRNLTTILLKERVAEYDHYVMNLEPASYTPNP